MVSFKLISAATAFVFAGVYAAAPVPPATASPVPVPAVAGDTSQQSSSAVAAPSGVTSSSPNVHYDHGKHLGKLKHHKCNKSKSVTPTFSAGSGTATPTDGAGAGTGTLPTTNGTVTTVAGTSGI